MGRGLPEELGSIEDYLRASAEIRGTPYVLRGSGCTGRRTATMNCSFRLLKSRILFNDSCAVNLARGLLAAGALRLTFDFGID
jgi:hypothetical protein